MVVKITYRGPLGGIKGYPGNDLGVLGGEALALYGTIKLVWLGLTPRRSIVQRGIVAVALVGPEEQQPTLRRASLANRSAFLSVNNRKKKTQQTKPVSNACDSLVDQV